MPDIVHVENIKEKKFFIRSERVMVDPDLAELYVVEIKRLNEQVKRNKGRFPPDFMFQLNDEEKNIMPLYPIYFLGTNE